MKWPRPLYVLGPGSVVGSLITVDPTALFPSGPCLVMKFQVSFLFLFSSLQLRKRDLVAIVKLYFYCRAGAYVLAVSLPRGAVGWSVLRLSAYPCNTRLYMLLVYSKPCLKLLLSKGPKFGFQDLLSLNSSQKYCRMLKGGHSAKFLTFIKLPFAVKIFVSSVLSGHFRQVICYSMTIFLLIRAIDTCNSR